MHSYLLHLLADIEALIKNPPMGPYIEVPPHLEEMPEVAELALAPFTTLEEITGISLESIPPFFEFTEEEWPLLAGAFKNLLQALNIAIVDLPENYPDDAYIDLIQCHWDEQIQYLPLAGYDMECCTGDNETCPYGDNCMICGPDAYNIDDDMLVPLSGGFFLDDGTPVDPMQVHVPGYCLACKSYLTDDSEQNILCTLMRIDAQKEKEFNCLYFSSSR